MIAERDLGFLNERDLGFQKILQLAKLDALEAQCWKAWRKSQETRETVREVVERRPIPDDPPRLKKRTVIRTSQAGDPRFLDLVLSCSNQRCKLLGLDAPKKERHIHVRWDLLTERQIDRLGNGEYYAKVLSPEQYYLE
jgi:hypothetical protein